MNDEKKMLALLDDWYIQMREQNEKMSKILKEQVDVLYQNINGSNFKTRYQLMLMRFHLLMTDYSSVLQIFSDLDVVKEMPDDLRYYYYFFNGIFMNDTGKYREALHNYKKAEVYLNNQFSDPRETAEFKYRLAVTLYRTNNITLSIKETIQALDLFKRENNENRMISCENLLGINNAFIAQYENAEYHYHLAKRYAENLNDRKKRMMIYQNLGNLYSRQNLNYSAIKFLEKVSILVNENEYDTLVKNLFVLSKEYFKSGEKLLGCKSLDRGLELSIDTNNQEYIHHFEILRSKYIPDAENSEEAFLNGLEYFITEELWEYVVEYSEDLAIQFQESQNFRDAVKYYTMAREARENIRKKGAIVQ